jgi:hypothetical protein
MYCSRLKIVGTRSDLCLRRVVTLVFDVADGTVAGCKAREREITAKCERKQHGRG